MAKMLARMKERMANALGAEGTVYPVEFQTQLLLMERSGEGAERMVAVAKLLADRFDSKEPKALHKLGIALTNVGFALPSDYPLVSLLKDASQRLACEARESRSFGQDLVLSFLPPFSAWITGDLAVFRKNYKSLKNRRLEMDSALRAAKDGKSAKKQSAAEAAVNLHERQMESVTRDLEGLDTAWEQQAAQLYVLAHLQRQSFAKRLQTLSDSQPPPQPQELEDEEDSHQEEPGSVAREDGDEAALDAPPPPPSPLPRTPNKTPPKTKKKPVQQGRKDEEPVEEEMVMDQNEEEEGASASVHSKGPALVNADEVAAKGFSTAVPRKSEQAAKTSPGLKAAPKPTLPSTDKQPKLPPPTAKSKTPTPAVKDKTTTPSHQTKATVPNTMTHDKDTKAPTPAPPEEAKPMTKKDEEKTVHSAKEPLPKPARKDPKSSAKKTPTPSHKKTPTQSVKKSPTPSAKKTPVPSNKKMPAPSEKKPPTPSVKKPPTPSVKKTPTPSVKKTLKPPTAKKTPTPSAKKTPTQSAKKKPTAQGKKTAAPAKPNKGTKNKKK